MAVSSSGSLDLLDRSFAAVGSLIGKIRPEQWSSATPCTDWTVRDVVGHVIGMNRVFAAMLADEPPPQRGGDLPDDELRPQYGNSAALLMAAFSEPGRLDRTYSGPLGSATGAQRLNIRLYDLLAHGWDIAQAIHQPAALPEDAAEVALAFVRAQLRDEDRAGRFGSPQEAPANATAIQRLVAYLGRTVP
jgi:uncharacterized protein (TIGR03086 family)